MFFLIMCVNLELSAVIIVHVLGFLYSTLVRYSINLIMGPFPFEIRRLKFQSVSCLHCIAVFEQLSN